MITKPRIYRLLEIMPGALMWVTLVGAFVLSFFAPLVVIYYIIIFDLYWLLRVIYFSVYLVASWKKYHQNMKIDWLARARALARFQSVRHLIILPTYKEDIEIIRASLINLKESNYPRENFIIVLAGEEKDRDNFLRNARIITDEFQGIFGMLVTTLHPAHTPGDIIGKGSNVHYAGKEARKIIDGLGISYDDVIVSIFDIDTLSHREYFAYLTYTYLTVDAPTRASYQPVAVYSNNIWESPAVVRIAAFGTTFWLMTELGRPERLITFSSHSMSFRALVDVGFHERDVVSEDSRIFLQCLLHYHGDYKVVPLFIPVYMNTVRTKDYWRSVGNLYRQLRRWAYGAENIPYIIWGFMRDKTIPRFKKIRYIWNLLEGAHSLATAPILIFMLGRLPLYVVREEVKTRALVSNTPFTLETLMTLAMFGVILSAVLSMILLPPRPKTIKPYVIFSMFAQWLLMPITFIVFGSIPAIDAQTRLMLGKYLGFWVTEKSK